MIGVQRVEVEGKRFVFLPEVEYERLCRGAGEAVTMDDEEMPALPKPDTHGRFPALQFARISLARDRMPRGEHSVLRRRRSSPYPGRRPRVRSAQGIALGTDVPILSRCRPNGPKVRRSRPRNVGPLDRTRAP